ncbi:cytochrome C oxidase subunit IV family protein [Pseudomonas yangonensis]|uniref:cytochrome C oxidase subunit IV family protein n=1 Tax=Pseudomonas yangonensis TaxID=2579922 RepID=UPI00137B6A8A|nr:cytochrome C oxidase subunit IV family protein [Pseudomonas yangonensis]
MNALLCWLSLILLSLLSLWLVTAPIASWTALALSAAALGKAWLIVDGFMELRHGPRLWRASLLAWSLCMASALYFAKP